MDETEIFGIIIKKIRTQKDLSQEKLAEKSGLDRTFISLIETGKRNPTLTTILKISRALNITPAELLEQFETRCNAEHQNHGGEDAN